MTGTVLLYAGLIAFVVGAITLVRPMQRLGIKRRSHAAVVLATGAALIVAAMLFPAADQRVTTVRTHLDREMPVYQFHERHVSRVNASPDTAYAAIKAVTANEIRFFRMLTWIRRGGRPLPEGILNAPERQPILETALRGGFVTLFEEPGREIVLGTIVKAPPGTSGNLTADVFRKVTAPGFAKATINFRVEPDSNGRSVVSTETRVFATDGSAKRGFARYWRVIYPGSAIIRRSWLQAIRRKAEQGKN